MQAELAPFDLPCALLDQREVVSVDPVGEQQTGDLDMQGPVREGQLLCRFEPGVEALSVDLLLQAGENSIPDVHIHARSASWAAFAR